MKRIRSDRAPKEVGPYAHAWVHNGMVYSSGQIAVNPKSWECDFLDQDVKVQTKHVLTNIWAVLEEAWSSLSHVVKATVYLADMADYIQMNEAYAEVFGDHAPARSAFAVAWLPLWAKVEIEVIAVCK